MADRDVTNDVILDDKTARGARSATRNVEQLEKNTSKITKRLEKDMIANGTKLGALLGENVAKGLSKAGPAVGPVLAGVIIGSLPFLGASVAAAIIGGAGIGGVIGGLILASKNPQVQGAASGLGSTIMSSLSKDADVFVDPILESLDTIRDGFNKVSGNIRSILGNSAKFVRPLTDGVVGFVTKVTRGIDKLVANAGPVIDVIKEGALKIGDAIEGAFDKLADNGVDAAVALDTAFNLVVNTIKFVGTAVNVLTETFGFLAKVGVFGRDIQTEWIRLKLNAEIATKATKDYNFSIYQTSQASKTAGLSLSELNEQTQDLTSSNQSLYSSQTSAAEAIANTTRSIKENGKTLDLNTEKGRANREALSNLASALNTQYQNTLKVNGAGNVAAGVAEKNRASFIKLATQLTGSATKAKELANQLLGIPDVDVNVRVHYSATGKERLDAAGHRIGGYFSGAFSGNTFATGNVTGTSRTGGPNQIASPVNNDVKVFIDGNPMRAEIRESQRKDRFSRTVGRRYAYDG